MAQDPIDHVTMWPRSLERLQAAVIVDRLNEQIRYAGLILSILVVALLVGASWGVFRDVSETLDHALVTGILLGLTGGVLSLAFTVA